MTNLECLLATKEWAENMLNTPESELPGTLTHAKCCEVLEDVEVKLVDHLGITLDEDKKRRSCYI